MASQTFSLHKVAQKRDRCALHGEGRASARPRCGSARTVTRQCVRLGRAALRRGRANGVFLASPWRALWTRPGRSRALPGCGSVRSPVGGTRFRASAMWKRQNRHETMWLSWEGRASSRPRERGVPGMSLERPKDHRGRPRKPPLGGAAFSRTMTDGVREGKETTWTPRDTLPSSGAAGSRTSGSRAMLVQKVLRHLPKSMARLKAAPPSRFPPTWSRGSATPLRSPRGGTRFCASAVEKVAGQVRCQVKTLRFLVGCALR